MKHAAVEYYERLRTGYTERIRQLVLNYDQMVACIVDLLELSSPRTALDVGAGTGIVTRAVLERIPGVSVTALDAVAEMLDEARHLLEPFGDRVTFLHDDIATLSRASPFDAVFSNLVIHNVTYDAKPRVLASIRSMLSHDGVFVWGDLIRYDDTRLQEDFVGRRIAFAEESGCPADLVRVSFEKEAAQDYPLTIGETTAVARTAGFPDPQLVWTGSTFAIFYLRARTA